MEEGIAITAQEAWLSRNGSRLHIPKYVQEVIERIAFVAREDKKIDKRSGVSQRLPISAMENVVSNAERRALTHQEKSVVPRISDIYAALPAITGKLELEYEGEMKGADHVSRELIRTAIAKAYDTYLHGVNMSQIVQWFDLGGEIQLSDNAGAKEVLEGLRQIQGLMEKLLKLNVGPKDSPEVQVSAAEFVLEGLHAHKKIGRNEERVFTAGEKQPKVQRSRCSSGKSRGLEEREALTRVFVEDDMVQSLSRAAARGDAEMDERLHHLDVSTRRVLPFALCALCATFLVVAAIERDWSSLFFVVFGSVGLVLSRC